MSINAIGRNRSLPRLPRWNCMPIAARTNNQLNSLNITQNLLGSQWLASPFSQPDRSRTLCNNESRNNVLETSAETLCCFHLGRRRNFARDWFARVFQRPNQRLQPGLANSWPINSSELPLKLLAWRIYEKYWVYPITICT